MNLGKFVFAQVMEHRNPLAFVVGEQLGRRSAARLIKNARGSLRDTVPRIVAQVRSVASSSASAHLITSSSFSPPCVNLDTKTVLIAWL